MSSVSFVITEREGKAISVRCSLCSLPITLTSTALGAGPRAIVRHLYEEHRLQPLSHRVSSHGNESVVPAGMITGPSRRVAAHVTLEVTCCPRGRYEDYETGAAGLVLV
jgi:hypothetical protein